MLSIERANAHRQNNFDGILTGKIDFNKQDELPRDKLVNLINHFSSQTFDRAHVSDDLFGNAYEYLIRNFASKAGKSSGEFYTPAEVGFLMAEVLQPRAGMSVCDWASGSGGLLLQCIRHVKKHGGDVRQLQLHGQESNVTTYIRHLIPKVAPARPQAFDLPALAESWRVEYREMRRASVGAKTDQPGRIVVFGAINDVDACHASLRRWLARRAAEALPPWLERVAAQCGQQPAAVAIKNQRTRWGSCAASGRISLNCKLLFLPRELVRYVMVHELCHLVEPNHSHRFWAHVRALERGADARHGQMRDAWKLVPSWAQRGTTSEL